MGGLFETTAVPELRIQAEALANHLVSAPYEPVETPSRVLRGRRDLILLVPVERFRLH